MTLPATIPQNVLGAASDFFDAGDLAAIHDAASRSSASPIEAAGRALYGDLHWRAQLPHALGISRRTVQRWDREPARIPGPILLRLYMLLAARMPAYMLAAAHIIEADQKEQPPCPQP